MDITRATTAGHFADATGLLRAYRAWRLERYADVLHVIDNNAERAAFDAKLARLDQDFSPPAGWLLIAYDDEMPVGCAGLSRFDAGACTLKRMYVANSHRGSGLGRRLSEAAIKLARSQGFVVMRLHSGNKQHEAHALYRSLGFVDIAAYDDRSPADLARLVFMELDLASPMR